MCALVLSNRSVSNMLSDSLSPIVKYDNCFWEVSKPQQTLKTVPRILDTNVNVMKTAHKYLNLLIYIYLKYVNTVYFVFKYKIHFEFASNRPTKYKIHRMYFKYVFEILYLKYFTTAWADEFMFWAAMTESICFYFNAFLLPFSVLTPYCCTTVFPLRTTRTRISTSNFFVFFLIFFPPSFLRGYKFF